MSHFQVRSPTLHCHSVTGTRDWIGVTEAQTEDGARTGALRLHSGTGGDLGAHGAWMLIPDRAVPWGHLEQRGNGKAVCTLPLHHSPNPPSSIPLLQQGSSALPWQTRGIRKPGWESARVCMSITDRLKSTSICLIRLQPVIPGCIGEEGV